MRGRGVAELAFRQSLAFLHRYACAMGARLGICVGVCCVAFAMGILCDGPMAFFQVTRRETITMGILCDYPLAFFQVTRREKILRNS